MISCYNWTTHFLLVNKQDKITNFASGNCFITLLVCQSIQRSWKFQVGKHLKSFLPFRIVPMEIPEFFPLTIEIPRKLLFVGIEAFNWKFEVEDIFLSDVFFLKVSASSEVIKSWLPTLPPPCHPIATAATTTKTHLSSFSVL